MVRIPEIHNHAHPHVPHPFEDMNDKLADKISTAFGSMSMFWTLVLWQLIWMLLAQIGFWIFKDDRYPFAFLLFLSNLIQLWALPVLGTTQNRADEKRNAKAEADRKAMTYVANRTDANAEKLDKIYDLLKASQPGESPEAT